MWKEGDKALCILEFGWSALHDYPNGQPAKGTIYLVEKINLDSHSDVGLIISGFPVCMSNSDLVNNAARGEETGWLHLHFRKIVTRSERIAESKKKAFMNKFVPPPIPPFINCRCKLEEKDNGNK